MKKPFVEKVAGFLLVVVLALLAYGGYRYVEFTDEIEFLEAESRQKIAQLESMLATTTQEKKALQEALDVKEQDFKELEETVEDALGEVGIFRKLHENEPELLQKYSRVFFLNEHYRPDKLKEIPSRWRVPEDDDEFIDERVWPHLEDLLDDAEDDGVDLRVISGFRSFDTQRELNDQYTVVYGQGTANQFSAEQGYSEHQLGTTVDFTTEELGVNYSALDMTEAFEWLEDNAYRYGFVLSYPENNQYYIYEPWHWRFVGRELAGDLHDDKENFYDLSQGEINKYRVDLFD